jgi:hypothetical protein
MDVRMNAKWAATTERTSVMPDLRKCIGSARFGIAAHDAPAADFPVQPSQKDGLGRMCKAHWNQYTTALRKAAAARTAEVATAPADATAREPVETKPRRAKAKASEPIAASGEGTTD